MFSSSDSTSSLLSKASAALLCLSISAYALKSMSTKRGDKHEEDKDKICALIGDVGGTNCRLQLVRLDLKTRQSQIVKELTTYPSQKMEKFESAIELFLKVSALTLNWFYC